MKNILTVLLLITLTGCASWKASTPDTQGEESRSSTTFGYHPLDPLPVKLTLKREDLLTALPDETMRLAIGTVSGDGSIAYGPAKMGYAGKSYVVVLDYIKFGTESFPTEVSKDASGKKSAAFIPAPVSREVVVVPVYIGVGLRLTANIYVKKGEVNLGSLFALGALAKAEQISGTLLIQTLGISGPEVSGLVPMPGEINESTIQNAILSLASIKAKMYDTKTVVTPRVVGVYNNLGGDESTINGFISSLLRQQLEFPRPQ